jgi:hypothetical protein
MKIFIRELAIFLLPLLAASYPLDRFLSGQIRKDPDSAMGEYSVWSSLYDGRVGCDVAIYGSSRAWVHIDPQVIEEKTGLSAFNLGIDGHNFQLQYLRHQVLLEKNSIPRLIIVSVDIFTLRKHGELYNSDQFLPYMLNNALIRHSTERYKGFSCFDYSLPLVRYYGKKWLIGRALVYSIFPMNTTDARHKGFKGIEQKWNNDFEKAKAGMSRYEVVFDPETVELFERFLMECRQKGIRVVLVYTPEYIEGQRFVKNRDEVFSRYRHLAEKFSIPLLDYSGDDICSQKVYFYNANHLNKTGASLFTNKLVDDLLKVDEICRKGGS